MISKNDWQNSYYSSADMQAFISLEAYADSEAIKECFLVNLENSEKITLMLKRYSSVNDALEFLNSTFSSWELKSSGSDRDSKCCSSKAGGSCCAGPRD